MGNKEKNRVELILKSGKSIIIKGETVGVVEQKLARERSGSGFVDFVLDNLKRCKVKATDVVVINEITKE